MSTNRSNTNWEDTALHSLSQSMTNAQFAGVCAKLWDACVGPPGDIREIAIRDAVKGLDAGDVAMCAFTVGHRVGTTTALANLLSGLLTGSPEVQPKAQA